jgi:aminoglycoside phosphotransferase (APT) family kinase protein
MNDAPSSEQLHHLLEIVSPGSQFVATNSLEGSFSNSTHLVDARDKDGSAFRIVTRRYAVFGDYDRGQKARREFKTLELLHKNNQPVPEPLYLDETGAVLGTPGIVTRYVPGQLVMSPPRPVNWAHTLAKTLATIHTVPVTDSTFLLKANSEALWFIGKGDAMPQYVAAHPLGPLVWETILEHLPTYQEVSPTLVHIDYWSGNILWDAQQISAVVDWEEAAFGDPGIDVAYCRMDTVLANSHDAADEFLKFYEAETGKPVANLGLWQLAASIRPMINPVGWVSESPAKERFAQFIDDAAQRTHQQASI